MAIVHRLLLPALAALVLILAGCGASVPQPRVGMPAPPLNLQSLNAQPVQLDALQNQVVIVNFWATWCEPCLRETPRLQAWFEQHESDGLRILGVNTTNRDSEDAVRAFVAEYDVTYPVLLDMSGEAADTWRIQQLPRSFVVDEQGVVRFVRIGELTEQDFDEQIAPLLQ